MGGALLQLVAYGAQDIFLTSQPQITFFKLVHRRHTNFAMESIEQTFNGSVDFNKTATALVSRSGDLMYRCWLEIDLPALANAGSTIKWSNDIAHVVLEYVDLDIGGTRIDRSYGDWLQIWNQLSQREEKKVGYNNLIGNVSSLTTAAASIATYRIRLPLQFWFNRNVGLALPLIALQYHEVKLTFRFRRSADCYITGDAGAADTTPAFSDAKLWIDYIFLDQDERKRFARVNHEYLIEQVQQDESSSSTLTQKVSLPFNHPSKALVWVAPPDANVATNVNEWTNYTNATGYAGAHTLATTRDSKLSLNGQERFAPRDANYFGLQVPYDYFTSIPSTGIYAYSFALQPEAHQPSGSLNLSRIDKTDLTLKFDAAVARKIRVYAINYNVLRVTSGMGGLAYAS